MNYTSNRQRSPFFRGGLSVRNLVAAFCLVILSCTPERRESPAVTPETGPGFERLREKYADVISSFPEDARSDEVSKLLVEAAAKERLVEKTSAEKELMYLLPNDNVGLYLFDVLFAELGGESREKAAQFCEEVRSRAPRTALAIASFDKCLMLEQGNPARFLEMCRERISDGAGDEERRVALLRRSEFYRQTGEIKPAALDALLFMALYPDVVRRMGIRQSLTATIREAGLILEVTLLGSSSDMAQTAKGFYDEFGSLQALSEDGPSSQGGPYSRIYWTLTPDLTGMQDALRSDETVSLGKAVLLARMASLAAYNLDADRVLELSSAYGNLVQGLLGVADVDTASLRFLASTSEALADNRAVIFREDQGLALSKRAGYNTAYNRALLGKATNALFDCWGRVIDEIHARDPSETPATLAEVIDKQVDMLGRFGNPQGVLRCYERFLARYPDSDLAPSYMMKMGDCYRDKLDAPRKAVETFAKLAERYPDSPEADSAMFKHGLVLYEIEQYEEALEVLQRLTGKKSASQYLDGARFLSALCLAGMGLSEESETQMLDIARGSPQSDVAPRALYWLASRKLTRQEYEEARGIFLELRERYPETTYGQQAKQYIERLGQLQQRAP